MNIGWWLATNLLLNGIEHFPELLDLARSSRHQPSIAISVEKSLPRLIPLIGTRRMPEPPVENHRRPLWSQDRLGPFQELVSIQYFRQQHKAISQAWNVLDALSPELAKLAADNPKAAYERMHEQE